ncbi:unnamed protein product [Schistosoma margrebowiei]|uniref:Uncharacterized protein n=1 Tax=Schistosoma margrebowiei TaxID=48269 RepID=A0A183MX75_9TREM|nr:unnamed protein product [Schistosoma margrebowiei]
MSSNPTTCSTIIHVVCDPWTRRLSSEEKETLKPVILHCESADEVIESIKERTGKQVTAADVKGMKAKLSTVIKSSLGNDTFNIIGSELQSLALVAKKLTVVLQTD